MPRLNTIGRHAAAEASSHAQDGAIHRASGTPVSTPGRPFSITWKAFTTDSGGTPTLAYRSPADFEADHAPLPWQPKKTGPPARSRPELRWFRPVPSLTKPIRVRDRLDVPARSVSYASHQHPKHTCESNRSGPPAARRRRRTRSWWSRRRWWTRQPVGPDRRRRFVPRASQVANEIDRVAGGTCSPDAISAVIM